MNFVATRQMTTESQPSMRRPHKITRAKFEQGLSVYFSADEPHPSRGELKAISQLASPSPRVIYAGQRSLVVMATYEPSCSPRVADLLAQSENSGKAQDVLVSFLHCIKQKSITVPPIQSFRAIVDLITLPQLQTTSRNLLLRPHSGFEECSLPKSDVPTMNLLLDDALEAFPLSMQTAPVESLAYLKLLQERGFFQTGPGFEDRAQRLIMSSAQQLGEDQRQASAQQLFRLTLQENARQFGIKPPPYER